MNGIAFNSNKILKRSFRNISKHSSKTTCVNFARLCEGLFPTCSFLLRAFFRIMFPAAFDPSGFSEGLYGDPGVWAPGKVGIELASEGQGKVKGVTTAWQGQGGWMDGFPIWMGLYSWCYALGASCLVNLLLLRNQYERKWSLGRNGGFFPPPLTGKTTSVLRRNNWLILVTCRWPTSNTRSMSRRASWLLHPSLLPCIWPTNAAQFFWYCQCCKQECKQWIDSAGTVLYQLAMFNTTNITLNHEKSFICLFSTDQAMQLSEIFPWYQVMK